MVEQLADRIRLVDRQNRELEARTMELSQANARLVELVMTDDLTGLRNRRYFGEAADRALSQASRDGSPLSLVIADLDHFKGYNDSFGHPAGDEVLRIVARLLTENVRAHDLVARFGGEEFVLLLPQADAAEAYRLTERLREAFDRHDWPHRSVASSFGISTADPQVAQAPRLLGEADAAPFPA